MHAITQQFEQDVTHNIAGLGNDAALKAQSAEWINQIARHKYTYKSTLSFIQKTSI